MRGTRADRRVFVPVQAALAIRVEARASADEPAAVGDPAVFGSEWRGGVPGAARRPGEKPVIQSRDAALVITDRKGEDFVGILARADGRRGEIRGTIKRNGAMEFTLTKGPTGQSRDLVGLRAKGKLAGGRMTLTPESNAGPKRAGTVGLEPINPPVDPPTE